MKRVMKANTPRDVEDYLARVPPIQRKALEQLRRTIKSVVPDAVEVISYQIPTFKLNGRMLVSYAAFNEHCSFFPGAGPTEAHQDELKAFATSKGTVRFTPEKPLSVTLVKKLVRTRIKLNAAAQKKRTAVR
jgi:uncharacterized protein YdhG (YjbR/CyaY superfamily)